MMKKLDTGRDEALSIEQRAREAALNLMNTERDIHNRTIRFYGFDESLMVTGNFWPDYVLAAWETYFANLLSKG